MNSSQSQCINSSFNITELNEQQYKAVTTIDGPLLVLAGAGSGKTKVLTSRIAHMVLDYNINPWQILAITFTNKAAQEMRSRLEALVPDMQGMWVSTFHAFCVNLLRSHAERLGYRSNFTIYDDSDSKRLVKTIVEDLKINTSILSIPYVRTCISNAKNNLVSVQEFEHSVHDDKDVQIAEVYEELTKRFRRANAMDFDDLLMYGYELLANNPDVLEQYQERFRYISIDEYQDTNHAQYQLTNLLASKYQNLMVVGDDDQSIYSWRGANIQNILNFEKDYPKAEVIKLEQNYRSTSHILNAANAVVAKNTNRKEKKLYSNLGDGHKIKRYQASDERDEGRFVASEIERLVVHEGYSYNDISLMYRTNAQSRVLEDMLLRAGVPYKVVGGTRFYDREEIRDVMSYLKLIINPADDVAFLRVVNKPRRGIGETSVSLIKAHAYAGKTSLFEAAKECIKQDGVLAKKARSSLESFVSFIETARTFEGELAQVIDLIVDGSGLVKAYEADHTNESFSRIENIKEFISVAQDFDETHPVYEMGIELINSVQTVTEVKPEDSRSDELMPLENIFESTLVSQNHENGIACNKLVGFVEWLALRSDLDTMIDSQNTTTLLTVHSAKGLEFPVVFVTGMEDGIFPHTNHGSDDADMEEERRLAYVAITRAQQRLYLTNARTRKQYTNTLMNPLSRFVMEIPAEHIQTSGIGSQGFSGTGWEKRGDRRATFGAGTEHYAKSTHRYRAPEVSKEKAQSQPESVKGTTNSERALNLQTESRALQIFAKGDTVHHKTFGKGSVLSVDGDMIVVRFERTGATKKLMLGFAPLVKLEG